MRGWKGGREGGSLASGLGVTWMLHESYMKVTRKLLVYVCIRVCINPLLDVFLNLEYLLGMVQLLRNRLQK